MTPATQTRHALIALMLLALAGCSLDFWLTPFGSYWYYVNGLADSAPDLIGMGGGSSTTSADGTTVSDLMDTTTTTDTDGDTTSATGDGTQTDTTAPSLFDDFGDGDLDGWNIISGAWSVTAGGWAQAMGPFDRPYYIMVVGDETWGDYQVDLDIRLDSGTEYAVGVRWVNDQTWYHCSHTVGGIATISKYVTGQSVRQLASGSSTPLPVGEWYHWRIVVQGNTIRFIVEGEQATMATDGTDPILAGGVALLAPTASVVNFDNVRVGPVED